MPLTSLARGVCSPPLLQVRVLHSVSLVGMAYRLFVPPLPSCWYPDTIYVILRPSRHNFRNTSRYFDFAFLLPLSRENRSFQICPCHLPYPCGFRLVPHRQAFLVKLARRQNWTNFSKYPSSPSSTPSALRSQFAASPHCQSAFGPAQCSPATLPPRGSGTAQTRADYP